MSYESEAITASRQSVKSSPSLRWLSLLMRHISPCRPRCTERASTHRRPSFTDTSIACLDPPESARTATCITSLSYVPCGGSEPSAARIFSTIDMPLTV